MTELAEAVLVPGRFIDDKINYLPPSERVRVLCLDVISAVIDIADSVGSEMSEYQ